MSSIEKIKDCPTIKGKLLVIINPYSGHGKAINIWKKISSAIENDTHIECEVVSTKAAGHAKDLVRTTNLQDYGGIVVVSGDGMIFEVINGLYQRLDWPVKIPLGIIPGGSGNGIHHSLLYQMQENFRHEISVATKNIVSGNTSPVDLIEVETNKTRLVSMLGVCWGLLSHAEIGTQKLRWLPSAWSHLKMYLCIAWRITFPREYHGTVSYLPLHIDTAGQPIGAGEERHTDSAGQPIGAGEERVNMPSLEQPVPDQWVTLKGPFLLAYACNQSWLDGDCLLCPSSRLDDGVIWLVVVEAGMSRRQMMDWLLNTDTARHLQHTKFVNIIPVRCFRFSPEEGSQFVLADAEPVGDGPVQGQIRTRVCPLMVNRTLQSRTD